MTESQSNLINCLAQVPFKERKKLAENSTIKYLCKCPDKERNICYICANECHKKHPKEPYSGGNTMFSCQCFRDEHKVNNNPNNLNFNIEDFKDFYYKKDIDDGVIYCNFIELSHKLGIKKKIKSHEEGKEDDFLCAIHGENCARDRNLVRINPEEMEKERCYKEFSILDLFQNLELLRQVTVNVNLYSLIYGMITKKAFKILFSQIVKTNQLAIKGGNFIETLPSIASQSKILSSLLLSHFKENIFLDENTLFKDNTIELLEKVAPKFSIEKNYLEYLLMILVYQRKFLFNFMRKSSITKYSNFSICLNPLQRTMFLLNYSSKVKASLAKLKESLNVLVDNIITINTKEINENRTLHSIIFEVSKSIKIFVCHSLSGDELIEITDILLKLIGHIITIKFPENYDNIDIAYLSHLFKSLLQCLTRIQDSYFFSVMDGRNKDKYSDYVKSVIKKVIELIKISNFSIRKLTENEDILNIVYFEYKYNDSIINMKNSESFETLYKLVKEMRKKALERPSLVEDDQKKNDVYQEILLNYAKIEGPLQEYLGSKIKFSELTKTLEAQLQILLNQLEELLPRNGKKQLDKLNDCIYLVKHGIINILLKVISYLNHSFTKKKLLKETDEKAKNLRIHKLVYSILLLFVRNYKFLCYFFFETKIYTIFFNNEAVGHEEEVIDSHSFYIELFKIVRGENLKVDFPNIRQIFNKNFKNIDFDDSERKRRTFLSFFSILIDIVSYRQLPLAKDLALEEVEYFKYDYDDKKKQYNLDLDEILKNNKGLDPEIDKEHHYDFLSSQWKKVYKIYTYLTTYDLIKYDFVPPMKHLIFAIKSDTVSIISKKDCLLVFSKFLFRCVPLRKGPISKRSLKISITKKEKIYIECMIEYLASFGNICQGIGGKEVQRFIDNPLNIISFFVESIAIPIKRIIYKFVFIDNMNENGKLMLRLIFLYYNCLTYFLDYILHKFNGGDTLMNKFYLKKYFHKIDSMHQLQERVEEIQKFLKNEIKSFDPNIFEISQIYENFNKINRFFNCNEAQLQSNMVRIIDIPFLDEELNRYLKLLGDNYDEFLDPYSQVGYDLSVYHKFENYIRQDDGRRGSVFQITLNTCVYSKFIDEFKDTPEEMQLIFLKKDSSKDFFIQGIEIFNILPDILLLEFASINCSEIAIYNYFMTLIECFRLLCENHNQVFQTVFLRNITTPKTESELDNEFDDDINYYLDQENNEDLGSEINEKINEIKNEVDDEIKDKKKSELKAKLKSNYKSSLESYLNDELESDINGEIESKTFEKFNNYLKNDLDSLMNYMFDFWNNINEFILLLYKRHKFLKYFKVFKYDKIEDVIKQITEFVVELIQGMYEFNHDTLSILKNDDANSAESLILGSLVKRIVLMDRDMQKLDIIEKSIMSFLHFMTNYVTLDSKLMEKISKHLIQNLSSNLLLKWLEYYFKRLYTKFFDKEEFLKRDMRNYHIKKNSYEKLIELYSKNNQIFEDEYFQVCTDIYKIFFCISVKIKDPIGESFDEVIEDFKIRAKNENPSDEHIERTEIAKFMSRIIKTIDIKSNESDERLKKSEVLLKYLGDIKKYFNEEISEKVENEINPVKFQKTEDKILQENFVMCPLSVFLNYFDLVKLTEDSPFEKSLERWKFLIDHFPEILNNLRVRQYFIKESNLMNDLNSSEFFEKLEFTCIFALLTNIFFFFPKSSIYHYGFGNLVLIMHMYYLFYCLSCWYYCKIISRKVFSLKKKDENEEFFATLFNSFLSSNALVLAFNLLFCFLAIIFPDYKNLFFSFQMFSFILMFPVMKSVIEAIIQRRLQFFYTFILIIILILLFSSISFYYYNTDFYLADINENFCESYMRCFLHMLNYGIRLGYIGDFSGVSEFQEGKYLFSWLFYFTMILIMLNVFNGIIVDTFQEIRMQKEQKQRFKETKCFICGQEKAYFEKKQISFDDHLSQVHDLKDYFDYFVAIHEKKYFELNSNETYIIDCIQKGKLEFFPKEQSSDLFDKN